MGGTCVTSEIGSPASEGHYVIDAALAVGYNDAGCSVRALYHFIIYGADRSFRSKS